MSTQSIPSTINTTVHIIISRKILLVLNNCIQGHWLPAGFQSPGAHVQAAGEGTNKEEEGRRGADCRGRVDQVHHGGRSNRVQILRIILKELNSANVK